MVLLSRDLIARGVLMKGKRKMSGSPLILNFRLWISAARSDCSLFLFFKKRWFTNQCHSFSGAWCDYRKGCDLVISLTCCLCFFLWIIIQRLECLEINVLTVLMARKGGSQFAAARPRLGVHAWPCCQSLCGQPRCMEGGACWAVWVCCCHDNNPSITVSAVVRSISSCVLHGKTPA